MPFLDHFELSGVASMGTRGEECPLDSKKFAKSHEKEGKSGKMGGKSGKNQKKRKNWEEKAKNWEGYFT